MSVATRGSGAELGPPGPAGTPGPPSTVGVVSLLVAGAYALGVVAAGARVVAAAVRPAQFGFSVNGDNAYPMVGEAIVGGILALIGAVLVVMVAAAVKGVRSAQLASTLFLAFFLAAGGVMVLNPSEDLDPCVDDSYSGTRVCVHPTTPPRLHGLQLGLPAAVAVLGMSGTVRRRPGGGRSQPASPPMRDGVDSPVV